MAFHHEERDTLSPKWSCALFECLSPRKDVSIQTETRTGYEREMAVMYQQPHLIAPMKLTVWDELPPTPPPTLPSHISQLVSQGRNIASRASGRASLSMRRKTPSKLVISKPQPAVTDPDDFPFRRRSFRPLQLSIYMPNNRLSDLPEFDALSFTDGGEIKFPPRALLRTRSEEIMPAHLSSEPSALKPASMYERAVPRMRTTTTSSVVSTSRPPSEHDALRSHPVSWCSMPGLPPQLNLGGRPENSVTVLTPMQEEFTPPATAALTNGIVMDFPQIETKQELALKSARPDFEVSTPSPRIPANPTERPIPSFVDIDPNPATSYFHTNYQTQKRISQWLGARSHSSSISTVKSSNTVKSSSSSFAEHRRKRSQFYQLSASYVPPQPLRLKQNPQHQRSMTVSTVGSTVDTDIMSLDNDDMESMTTAPTASELQSRTGTVKSVSAGIGVLRPIVSGVPELPDQYGAIMGEKAVEEILIAEINGPLRSPLERPGVGLAF